MAKSRNQPHSSVRNDGPQGIRLSHVLIVLISATILGTVLLHYQSSNLDIPNWNDEPNHYDQDPRADKFQNDLDVAKQAFGGARFNLDPIIGARFPFWGSINSGHYFGMKTASPKPIETSLMWFENMLNDHGRLNIRHLCSQNDGLKAYAWTHHDFWTFGRQIIKDGQHKLTTSYIKTHKDSSNWQAKIDISGNYSASSRALSVIQYITIDDDSNSLSLNSSASNFTISGSSADLGNFVYIISFNQADIIKFSHIADRIDKTRSPISDFLHSKMTWSMFNKSRIFHLAGKQNPNTAVKPNIVAVQITLRGPAQITLEFRRIESEEKIPDLADYVDRLEIKMTHFDGKLKEVFPMTYHDKSNTDFARIALSNMIGSVGYFYGNSYIDSNSQPGRISPYGPIQLLTGVPSRSFFPRGFLWDEGFHDLLISRWDSTLSTKIIKSWFNIMNVNGWIPREVILGIESMRRVPNEFIIQRISNANPPAMLLVIEEMLDKGALDKETIKFLYPRLKQWIDWFNVTQSGPHPSTYRWRGRDEISTSMLNPKTLTSGLDDYPRASHPSQLEYHIDLRCWMALASRTLAKFGRQMYDHEFENSMQALTDKLSDNKLLDRLHWSEAHDMYCDFGLNAQVELVWVTKTRRTQEGTETYRVLERQTTGHPKMECIPEFGYVSLFPMIMRLLDPNSEKLGITLNKMHDDRELWTPYGIRSLSKSSNYYNKYNTEHDKPYWRGSIWLNINYLILNSLRYYSQQEGPYREKSLLIAQELKQNLISNVKFQFTKTNYLWENYNDTTGNGQGSHPFTGWSSLILIIMSSDL